MRSEIVWNSNTAVTLRPELERERETDGQIFYSDKFI